MGERRKRDSRSPSNESRSRSPIRRARSPDRSPVRKGRSPDISPQRKAHRADRSPVRKARSPDRVRSGRSPDRSPGRRTHSPNRSPARRQRSPHRLPERQTRSPERARRDRDYETHRELDRDDGRGRHQDAERDRDHVRDRSRERRFGRSHRQAEHEHGRRAHDDDDKMALVPDHSRAQGKREHEQLLPPPPPPTDLQGPPQPPAAAAPPQGPNMALSGKLAAETAKVNGVELKYQPSADAAKPDKRWRLYVFKGDQLLDEPYYIHRQDHYLFGRQQGICDIVAAHPSISKQHAVLQFRQTAKEDAYGLLNTAIRPYLMDLNTVNGTLLNGERIEPQKYYELLEKDVIKFAQSTREYVLLHDKSTAADDHD